jgi:ubiquinone biosynthesis protein UbiJ
MPSRKMTFSLPESLVASFSKRVPARDRSRYVAEAIAEKLAERERRLIRACEIANDDPQVRQIEREFDNLTDAVQEPWERAVRGEDAAAR